ncbi:DMT family transporter [Gammaproteobacteria bacterium]|nr:DMT family transporter [Gammaproteobacteria bacterium]
MNTWALAAITILSWSSAATAFKFALVGLSPLEVIAIASVVALLLLALMLTLKGEWPQMRHWTGKDWRRSLLLGALNPTLYYLVLFLAYERLPAQLAQPINFLWPIVLMLMLAASGRHTLTRPDWLALLTCLIGVGVLSLRGQWHLPPLDDLLGVGLALASTLIWASYWLVNVSDDKPPLQRLFANFAVSAPLCLIAAVASGAAWPTIDQSFMAALWIGAFEMAIPFVCWFLALRDEKRRATLGTLIYLTPVLALLWIALLLGEPIAPTTLIGLALILGAIILQQHAARRQR